MLSIDFFAPWLATRVSSFRNAHNHRGRCILPTPREERHNPWHHVTHPLPFKASLHVLKDGLLELALNRLAGLVGSGLAVEREEGAEVELRCLEELDLTDVDLV